MIQSKSIAVVIPCFNEESQISMVLDAIPDFVDLVIAVNDKSTDRTLSILKNYQLSNPKFQSELDFSPIPATYVEGLYSRFNNFKNKIRDEESQFYIKQSIFKVLRCRLVILSHEVNSGVGAAIASGYRYARECGIDCTAVMAGDGQMDPLELKKICMPVVNQIADYSKGNRLRHRISNLVIPRVRFLGNSVLSMLTKIASGYWRVSDTQTGYTAISLEALEGIDIHKIYKSYGMPNDLLVKLNIGGFKITEVLINPVYEVGEKSKMKIHKVIPRVSLLLLKLFIYRIFNKYFFRDFHPLFLLYLFGFLGALISVFIFIKWYGAYLDGNIMYGWLLIMVSMLIFSFQSFIFAMWFDMQDNERLYV